MSSSSHSARPPPLAPPSPSRGGARGAKRTARLSYYHVWTRGKNSEDTFEVLMLMMILSFMLVVAYHAQVDPDALWEKLRLRRLTLRHLAEDWLMTLYEAVPLWEDAG